MPVRSVSYVPPPRDARAATPRLPVAAHPSATPLIGSQATTMPDHNTEVFRWTSAPTAVRVVARSQSGEPQLEALTAQRRDRAETSMTVLPDDRRASVRACLLYPEQREAVLYR